MNRGWSVAVVVEGARNGFSYGMAVDAEDNPWWSVWNADTVFKADLKTGEITEIPMRDPEYGAWKALATPADLEFYESVGSQYWGGNSANPVSYANAPRRLSADNRKRTTCSARRRSSIRRC